MADVQYCTLDNIDLHRTTEYFVAVGKLSNLLSPYSFNFLCFSFCKVVLLSVTQKLVARQARHASLRAACRACGSVTSATATNCFGHII